MSRTLSRVSLPVLDGRPMAEREERLSVPEAPSWSNLWLRIALTGTAILLAIFGGYEIVERTWLADADPGLIYVLHITRGMGAAVILGTWAFYLAMRTRRYYDGVLTANIHRLEKQVRERTAELERSRAFTEHLFDSLKDRIIVTDRRGVVVKANRVARDAAADELCGRVCTDVFTECAGSCAVMARLNDEGPPEPYLRRDERTGRLWSIDVYPVPSIDDGRPELVLEVGRDVTDEKQLEAQVRHQEKMACLGMLAAGMAHDIGNPLASLSSELELLELEDDQDATKDSLGTLRTHVDRIGRTLREMVDFARRRGEEVSRVSVSTAVDDALRLVRHDKRVRDVTLVTDVPYDLPGVKMVEDHLVMVIVNLLINALDAMPEGGELTVRARREDEGVRVDVIDTGVGMSEDVLAHVFDPLFTTKSERGGTGLGMTVSQSVVRAVGGRMDVRSAPGEGTVVSLVLPAGGDDD